MEVCSLQFAPNKEDSCFSQDKLYYEVQDFKISFTVEKTMIPKRKFSGCRVIVCVLVIWLLYPAQFASAGAGELFIDLGRGPVLVRVPASYDPETPTPLVMLLHGYSATGQLQEATF